MTLLKNWDGSDWVVALPPTREDRILARTWHYSAYDPLDLHASTDRSFTLRETRIPGVDITGLTFIRLDIWARIGQLGSNSITYGTATSNHVVTSPWSNKQFVKHFGFTEEPTGGDITVTTNYPMTTDPPSLYIFAVGIWN